MSRWRPWFCKVSDRGYHDAARQARRQVRDLMREEHEADFFDAGFEADFIEKLHEAVGVRESLRVKAAFHVRRAAATAEMDPELVPSTLHRTAPGRTGRALDLLSRRVVGWAMQSATRRTQAVCGRDVMPQDLKVPRINGRAGGSARRSLTPPARSPTARTGGSPAPPGRG